MKRKIMCIGLCVFSLSLLLGGCADNAAPTESPPVIAEAEEALPSESKEIEKERIEPTQSPQPSASTTLRPSATVSPAPTATQSGSVNVNTGNSTNSGVSQAASDASSQASAQSTMPSATPTPAPTPDPNAGKTWHDAVYEDVWVVDEPARTVEEPVVEKRERTYCFLCDTDITGNIPAHGDEHFDREEDFQYGGKLVEVQTGVEQVTIPEKGHWEKKLMRKAGWY